MDFYNYQKDLSQYYSGSTYVKVRFTPPMTFHQVIAFIVIVLAMFLLLLTVGVLFCFQLYYAISNRTTIETFELEAINSLVKRKDIPECEFPYDIGIVNNLKAMLGANYWLWWAPLRNTTNGYKYQVSKSGTIPWPPREYYLQLKYPTGKGPKPGPNLNQSISTHDEQELLQHEMSSTDYDSLESDTDDDDVPLQQRKDHLKAK